MYYSNMCIPIFKNLSIHVHTHTYIYIYISHIYRWVLCSRIMHIRIYTRVCVCADLQKHSCVIIQKYIHDIFTYNVHLTRANVYRMHGNTPRGKVCKGLKMGSMRFPQPCAPGFHSAAVPHVILLPPIFIHFPARHKLYQVVCAKEKKSPE